ncbi:hypothetical protein P4641_08625 [Halalkalibacterium halodurans]|uniref:hypothetical protein n=1 Tax=Halalkalibacterium halodurans TaxID=86665 RepID=UPI002E1AC733|nr:hypothetical protein [Halalkalibacterium halodurans]
MNFTREEIVNALQRKGATNPCAKCSGNDFILEDDYFRHDIQNNTTSISIGGQAIMSFGLVCSNCGNITFHAVKALFPDRE